MKGDRRDRKKRIRTKEQSRQGKVRTVLQRMRRPDLKYQEGVKNLKGRRYFGRVSQWCRTGPVEGP